MEIKGIDVSKYQGTIDWQRVAASGVRFAFVRVGWAGYEGGIDEGADPNISVPQNLCTFRDGRTAAGNEIYSPAAAAQNIERSK